MGVRKDKHNNGLLQDDIKGTIEFWVDGTRRSERKYYRKWNRSKEIDFWKENFDYKGKYTYIIIKPTIEI